MFLYVLYYYYYFIIVSLVYAQTIKDRDQFLFFCESLVSRVLKTFRHSVKFYMNEKIKHNMIEAMFSKKFKFQKEV